jgi:hypothetical protein
MLVKRKFRYHRGSALSPAAFPLDVAGPAPTAGISRILFPILGAIVPLLLSGAPLLGSKIVKALAKSSKKGQQPALTTKEEQIIADEVSKLVSMAQKSAKSKKKGSGNRKPRRKAVPVAQMIGNIPTGLPFSSGSRPKSKLRGISLAQLEHKLGSGIVEY